MVTASIDGDRVNRRGARSRPRRGDPRPMLRALWLSVGLAWIGADRLAAGDFHDSFRGRLAEGWTWVREDPAAWRLTPAGLEIRVQPGNLWGPANNARNVLVRPAPDPTDGDVTVSVRLENRPTEQYEQVDLVWYYDDAHMVKLGQEQVDGRLCIVMGREQGDKTRTIAILPLESFVVEVRFRVSGTEIRGEFRVPGEATWRLAGVCDLPVQGAPKVSLQCYQGPAAAERWARLTDFRMQSTVR